MLLYMYLIFITELCPLKHVDRTCKLSSKKVNRACVTRCRDAERCQSLKSRVYINVACPFCHEIQGDPARVDKMQQNGAGKPKRLLLSSSAGFSNRQPPQKKNKALASLFTQTSQSKQLFKQRNFYFEMA